MTQVILSGIILGGIYAFIALGFSVTWQTTRTLSFAQGELVTLGALLGCSLNITLGVPWVIATIVVILVGAIAAIAIYKFAISPFGFLGEKGVLGWVLATVAISILLRNVYELVWGKEPVRWDSPFTQDKVEIGDISLRPSQIAIIVAVGILALLSHWILTKTLWGKAFQAVAQDADASGLSGISPTRVSTFAFGVSGALAAFAGVLLAPVTLAAAHMGFTLVVSAFAVAVFAGLNSMRGILIISLFFGAYEALIARFFGAHLKEIAGLLLLVTILMVRPTGVFGRKQVAKV